jgi:hypothetical protein
MVCIGLDGSLRVADEVAHALGELTVGDVRVLKY